MAEMPESINLNLNVTVTVGGEVIPGQLMSVPICACCSYRASERGEWPKPLLRVASGDTQVEQLAEAGPGTPPVRLVDVTPGNQAVVCSACADQQCNGCYHCATHCSCPPGTGRPRWILPDEVAP